MTKTVSRFEYAIEKHIDENIAPRNMEELTCKTKDEEHEQRKRNLKEKVISLQGRVRKKSN